MARRELQIMERPYRALRLKVRKYLRSEHQKKTWMGRYLSVGLFDKRMWQWEKSSVALGACFGGIASLLPIPMQSCWAVVACLWNCCCTTDTVVVRLVVF